MKNTSTRHPEVTPPKDKDPDLSPNKHNPINPETDEPNPPPDKNKSKIQDNPGKQNTG